MADYQKIYLHMFNAVSRAAAILLEAQQEAEDMFIDSAEVSLILAGEGTDGEE